MRILLLTAYFPPETGSGPFLFYEMGAELVRRGYDVTVITGMPDYHVSGPCERYRGRWFLRETVDGMTVRRVRAAHFRNFKMLGRGLWHISVAFSSLLATIVAGKFDVAAVFSPPLFLALVPWLRRVPFLLNIQDLFPQGALDLGAIKKGVVAQTLERVESFLYRRAGHITVHSAGNREHVLAHGAEEQKKGYEEQAHQPIHNGHEFSQREDTDGADAMHKPSLDYS